MPPGSKVAPVLATKVTAMPSATGTSMPMRRWRSAAPRAAEERPGREQQHRQAQHPAGPVAAIARRSGADLARRRPRTTAWPASSPASCRNWPRTGATGPGGSRRGAVRAPARRHRARRRSRRGGMASTRRDGRVVLRVPAHRGALPGGADRGRRDTIARRTSACSMMPAQAAQYMPDRRSVDSAMRRPSRSVDQRVKRCCSSGSSSTDTSGVRREAGDTLAAWEFIGCLRVGRGGRMAAAIGRMIDNPVSRPPTLHEAQPIDQARPGRCSAWRWPSPAALWRRPRPSPGSTPSRCRPACTTSAPRWRARRCRHRPA